MAAHLTAELRTAVLKLCTIHLNRAESTYDHQRSISFQTLTIWNRRAHLGNLMGTTKKLDRCATDQQDMENLESYTENHLLESMKNGLDELEDNQMQGNWWG
jgi:hypothetical protein